MTTPTAPDRTARTTCVIAGGGPAGMILGLLLARAGVEVTVLEKHADFLRDFRGDTVHASTLRLLDELGLGRAFDRLPHAVVDRMEFPNPAGGSFVMGDFRRLPGRYQHIAMVPQWDLLDLLAEAAGKEPTFTLRMNTEVTAPIRHGGKVIGVNYRTTEGETGELLADLTVAADGRWSPLREAVGLRPHEYPVPFDVWWFRVSRRETDAATSLRGRFADNQLGLSINRGDNFQCAYFNRKNFDDTLRAEGIEAFRARFAALFPDLADRVTEIEDLDQVKHLDVRLNRLSRWHVDGLLCIGDAAHAMTPIGGVGINLAIQDAVAAARLLAGPLRQHRVRPADLAKVRKRRWLPTVIVQGMQRMLQTAVVAPVLNGERSNLPKLPLWLFRNVRPMRYLPAYLIAIGPRPEHAPAFARRPESTPESTSESTPRINV
ncbi:MAG TPA: FAD-dependent oxidoreductase [Pseudonocardiaceae bacterium]|jgi:2-polyprenyl-6-methoxyphenol hydroxylase-like FAD-dependent oxidoreductase|nr:FAD-dependent oxidoreductase [Pseudonocardiaceae bacterium]